MATILIRGATVIDGTGAPGAAADVLLADGKIAAAADRPRDADRVVDAGGLVLAPGFIDAHSHADNAPLLAETDIGKLSQGVTTEVVGNCGFAPAPCPPGRRAEIERLRGRLFPALPSGWSTVDELYRTLDTHGYPTNTVPLAGHHLIRAAVLGTADRRPREPELALMKAELSAALAAGAAGLSSGLIYPPGMYGDVDELAALAGELPPGAVYASHLRNESGRLLESVGEAIEVARRAGCRLQVSHLKAAGQHAWGSVKPALRLMDEARAEGITVHHDVYPYEANSTLLSACLPPWFHDGGHAATMARLRDPDALRRAERAIAEDDGTWENWVAGSGWDRVLVAGAGDPGADGRTLGELAASRRRPPFRVLADLLLTSELTAWMSVFAMSSDDVTAALLHPRALVGSDGAPPGGGGKPHPRGYGTFTRVLARYVRDTGLLSWEEAIAKMTSRTASAFGLAGRGVIATGAAADVVLFDPAAVADRATFTDPTRVSAGIELVVVNGQVAFEAGKAVGPRAGHRLRPIE
ncbi:N-acyl-D-amino-acid deacylase family protein [Amycolatopsis sp. cmx-4-61]|uniref:N-acyl-D-amino-acid deacylase family protein n=1 Tax=Amycolatopsis sp. cmx-4-61 TaxID=2790937 RepID=UPI00397E3E25